MPDLTEEAMAIDEVDRTVVTQEPSVVPGQAAVTTERHVSSTRTGPGPSEMTRRIIYLVFGLIQLVIGARIVLLLLNAREGNALVSGILNLSQPFVAPFEGILNSNSLHAAGSVLDLAAILAFVGWTILEFVIIWVIGIFRREPA
jgi:hypothetical protein